MSFYPATIVVVTDTSATARLEATGQQIVLSHTAHNAVPPALRHVGAQGYISFPKAPPVFTAAPDRAAELERPAEQQAA